LAGVLMVLSMLLKGTINVAYRDVCCVDIGFAGREISSEEGSNAKRLLLSGIAGVLE
jgi:hypothetical protein